MEEFLEKQGEGVQYIVIKVSHFDEAVDWFKKNGIEPISILDVAETSREALYDPKDTFGVPIILNEYSKTNFLHRQSKRIRRGRELFEDIDRTVIMVRDFDKAVSFFSNLLGVKFDTFSDEDTGVMVAHSRDGFGLELASPLSDKTPLGADCTRFLEKHGEGLQWVVIKVSNMKEAVQRLKEHGVAPLLTLELDNGKSIETLFNPEDTFGLPIILNEYTEDSFLAEISQRAES